MPPERLERRYDTTVTLLRHGGAERAYSWFFSDSIPDLCAIAATLAPAFELTIYLHDLEWYPIIEEYDEPGDKGNYGGFWHTTTYYPGGLPPYLKH